MRLLLSFALILHRRRCKIRSNPVVFVDMKKTTSPERGLVLDIDRFATHDGPGIRTAVFLKGCSLRCAWCHSPESQCTSPELIYMENRCTACGLCLAACPQAALQPVEDGAGLCRVALNRAICDQCAACVEVCYPGALKLAGQWWDADALAREVARDAPFFEASGGGVTLSGGEASQQGEFAVAFLTACRGMGLPTAIETNGFAPWPVFERLAQVTDLFLFDLKLMDDRAHRKWTGASNRTSQSNLRRLAGRSAKVIPRVPCIPGINDDAINIEETARFVRGLGLNEIHLLAYNAAAPAKYAWLGRPYALEVRSTQDAGKMDSLAQICRSYDLQVQVVR